LGWTIAGKWTGFAGDGSPLVLRDTGIEEIYALDWEAPSGRAHCIGFIGSGSILPTSNRIFLSVFGAWRRLIGTKRTRTRQWPLRASTPTNDTNLQGIRNCEHTLHANRTQMLRRCQLRLYIKAISAYTHQYIRHTVPTLGLRVPHLSCRLVYGSSGNRR